MIEVSYFQKSLLESIVHCVGLNRKQKNHKTIDKVQSSRAEISPFLNLSIANSTQTTPYTGITLLKRLE